MANNCYTTYKITGSQKAVRNLWDTLESMDVKSKDVWLAKLAEHYGIDYQKRQVSVRGNIIFAEYEYDEKNDWHLLTLETDTAWAGCHDCFHAVNEGLGDEMSISYREIEPGCIIFCVHDEGEFFTEECCVSCSGEPFDDLCDDGFDTVEDAIQEWCSKMGVERGDKPEDEMMDYINEYEYDDLDTYFYINRFTFE